MARFIADSDSHTQELLIDKYKENFDNDNVFSLLYDIKPEVAETLIIIPAIDELKTRIGFKNNLTSLSYKRYCQILSEHIYFSPDDIIAYGGGDNFYRNLLFFVTWNFDSPIPSKLKYEGNSLNKFSKNLANELYRLYPNKGYSNSKITDSAKRNVLIREMIKHDSIFQFIKQGALLHFVLPFDELERVFKIHQELVEKHSKKKHSLDDILKKKS